MGGGSTDERELPDEDDRAEAAGTDRVGVEVVLEEVADRAQVLHRHRGLAGGVGDAAVALRVAGLDGGAGVDREVGCGAAEKTKSAM